MSEGSAIAGDGNGRGRGITGANSHAVHSAAHGRAMQGRSGIAPGANPRSSRVRHRDRSRRWAGPAHAQTAGEDRRRRRSTFPGRGRTCDLVGSVVMADLHDQVNVRARRCMWQRSRPLATTTSVKYSFPCFTPPLSMDEAAMRQYIVRCHCTPHPSPLHPSFGFSRVLQS